MKITWIGLTLLALATAATGCDSKPDATAPAGSAVPGAAAPGAAGVEKKDESKPAGSMEEQSLVLMDKMSDIFSKNVADCDKMGTELDAFIKDNTDTFKKLKEYGETQSPEQKKAFTEKNKDKLEGAMKKMEPGIKACATNQKVQGAMKSMPL